MKFKIRRLKLSEVKEAEKIVGVSLENDFPEYEKRVVRGYQKMADKKFFRERINKDGIIFGTFDNKKLIGVIAMRKEGGGVAFIDWLVVDRNHRRSGVGSKLLAAAEKWLLQHKFHCIYLYVESQKKIDFYKNRGLEYVGKMRKAWFGADEYMLQKILKDKPSDKIF